MSGTTATARLIGPFRQIITLRNLPFKGGLSDEQLEIIPEGGILIRNSRFEAVGSFSSLQQKYKLSEEHITYLEDDFVCLPGLIDAHTHICFGGSRAHDYAMRIAGKSYLQIAKEGGGIWSTVTQTRNADKNQLSQGIISRLDRHLAEGVTTCEIKSGYGLSVESELKMLRAINRASELHPVDVVTSCLAAHIKPKDFDGNTSGYLDTLIRDLLPIIKKEKLTNRVDIFIEEGAFGVEESQAYLMAAKQMGFKLTVHADQFHPGGSLVAVKTAAVSADHLEASGEAEINALAESETVAVALPGASLGLGCGFTPARKLLDAGASLAIASDWNPGSAPMGDLLMQAAVLGASEKLTNAETFAAMTFRAAKALNLMDRGRIDVDLLADFIAFPTNDYKEILYHQGKMKPDFVWKNGNSRGSLQ